MRRLLAVLVLVGCGGGGGADDDDVAAIDARVADAGSPDAAGTAWIEDYEREIVMHLAQAPRQSVAARDATRAYLEGELARWGYTATEATYGTGANVLATLPATTD